MPTYGFDIDGILTRVKLLSGIELFILRIVQRPQGIWKVLFSLSLFLPVDKAVKVFIQKLYRKGHRIIIVSARPQFLFELTKRWLRKNEIPCHHLVLNTSRQVSSVEFKRQTIEEFRIDYFFDNSVRIRKLIPNALALVKLYRNSLTQKTSTRPLQSV